MLAMATAYKLQDYEDLLDPETLFSTLSLVAALNKCFGTCSKAFTRLESLPGVSSAPHDIGGLLSMTAVSPTSLGNPISMHTPVENQKYQLSF